MWYLYFVLLLSVLLTILRFKNRRKIFLANQIPGPKGSLLVGMLPMFLLGPEKIIKCLIKVYRKYENTSFKMWICNRLYIVLTRPEDIEFVLFNPKLQKKAKEYKVLTESVMGQGIFSIKDTTKWKSNRKMVVGGFNFSIIKSFIPIFYNEANTLAEILEKNSDPKSRECEISLPINMATMEMIGKTALGVTFNAQNGGHHPFVKNLRKVMFIWGYRITRPWFLSKTLFRFSRVKREHDKSQQIINSISNEIIQKKLIEINENESCRNQREIDDDDDAIRSKKNTVIEILLRNHHEISHEQIRDEVITVMIGGQETTAMVNACVIFMLAHHQNIQNKLFEEIESIFLVGDYNRQPTYEDILRMEYLERVIKETMRFFPPLPVFARSLDEDMQIGEHLCPAGSSLLAFPLLMHSSSKYYIDPEIFNPDNFLPDMCRNRHPCTYLPFSAGYRNCIGIKYAMLQMKTVISTLMRKYKFFPSDRCPTPNDLRLMLLVTLKFADDCYVKVETRT